MSIQKLLVSLSVCMAMIGSLYAQNPAEASTSIETPIATDSVYSIVDKMPEFPGGQTKMFKFLAQNIRYPSFATSNNISGKVLASFIIGKDGIIREVTTDNIVGYGCDEEVIRLVKAMPKWIPGEQNGQKVAVRYSFPVTFGLVGSGKKRKTNH